MRGGARAVLAVASCVVVGLTGSAPAAAKARKAPAPRGWVVDRVRLENASPDGFVGVDDLGQFRGVLDLVAASGGLAVINQVPFEEYVQGIAEVPSGWPAEALKAQAIAARTYALHELR
jgi:peptidoglycan hydrolase-like amidase